MTLATAFTAQINCISLTAIPAPINGGAFGVVCQLRHLRDGVDVRRPRQKVIDEQTSGLIATLLAYPDVQADWNRPGDFPAATDVPVIPVCFMKNRLTLSYFSLVSTVGTPQTISAQELRIECMYPADEATEIQHLQLMKQRPGKAPAR